MSDSFVTLWTIASQAPLSMGFSRQEYWSEFLFPSPGDLPYPGIKPTSPALPGRFFTTEPPALEGIGNHSAYNDTGIKNNIDCNSGLESLEGGRETREKVQLLPPHTVLSDLIREWIYFTDQARLEVRKVSFAFPFI